METIYNITAAVDADVASGWVEEVLGSYLPALSGVSGVMGVELIEVLAPDEEQGSRTFTVQVRFADMQSLDTFKREAEREAEERLFRLFGDKYVTFRLHLNSLHKAVK